MIPGIASVNMDLFHSQCVAKLYVIMWVVEVLPAAVG